MKGLACTQDFLEGAGDTGAVYVSLGTVCTIGAEEFRELASALSNLPRRVVWKVGRDDLPTGLDLGSLGLGRNVKVVQWAPQNDLLGSGHIGAFLTHGGINGLYEVAPLYIAQALPGDLLSDNGADTSLCKMPASYKEIPWTSHYLDQPSVGAGCVSCGANRGHPSDSGPA
jgi:hypothetical protein